MELDLSEQSQNRTIIRSHEWYMHQALKEAAKACQKNETPIGSVIVSGGKIISRGHNQKERNQDPTLHAEITAIRKACRKTGSWRLDNCDMYVTLEPCTMCAGAILHARIKRLFIGTSDPKAGAVGSVIDVLGIGKFNHKVEVHYGILESECSLILKDFFKELRIKKKQVKLQQKTTL